MAIVQEFDLNMIPDSAPMIVHVNQYDEGEGRFEIHLYDGNVPYVPAAGAEAIIQGTKPDGKGFDYDATLSGSTVTADVTKQMTAVAGVVRVQVVITEGDDVTGTFVFGMDVQKSGLPADTDMSASEYQIVEQLIETAEAINANPPKIGENGHWWVWDTPSHAYIDSGVDASISVDIADITMLAPDATPYVTNTGTETDPIFHLFIPRGQPGKGISSIAKTGTSGYVDTYTITYTDNTSTTYTVTNGRNTDQVSTIPTASASLVGTIYQYVGASTSSYTHGFYYECVNDGGTYKWVNIPVGNDPVAVESSDPYTYRQSKGNLADMEIVGASVGWNQLARELSTTYWNVPNPSYASITSSDGVITFTLTADPSPNMFRQGVRMKDIYKFPIKAGHKYSVSYMVKPSKACTFVDECVNATASHATSCSANTWTTIKFIETAQADRDSLCLVYPSNLLSVNDTYQLKNLIIIDLTQAFNPTVADAIYAMEQAQAGTGVAFFRKYFPKDYYAYDAGSIQSVCVGSRKVVGKNLQENRGFSQTVNNVTFTVNNDGSVTATGTASADTTFKVQTLEQTSCIQKAGNYILSIADTNGSNSTFQIVTYAKHNNNTLMFDIVSNDREVAVSLNEDPTNWYFGIRIKKNYNPNGKTFYPMIRSAVVENGTWEPYNPNQYEYPFDSTKELRGMFNLEGGELKANGDIYTADGNIQRKYGIVDLGTLTWNYNDSNMFETARTSYGGKSQGTGICTKYVYGGTTSVGLPDKQFSMGANYLVIRDDSYTDAATFTTAMSGVMLVYELATPTTESAQPYQNPQRAYIDGTEEFTDGLTRDVMIPVGNNTVYQQDKILPSVEDYVDSITDTKTDISAIAPEENGATSSKAYTIGQHFYKDGKFCTAIAAIASNAAFTLNTNYVEGTIAEALEAINVNGGHTIVNSSGSSMTARSKLKFANATVTDDPANDQTVITTNPASAEQTATLSAENFIKHNQESGVYYITRSGFCEVHINTIQAKNAGQGLLVATGLPLSAFDGIIMGNTPYFEDGTAFYINTTNNTTSLYALIPDTGVKSGCVIYMTK